MQIIPLYRYERPEGGITVSPVRPNDIEFAIKYRLIADEGMILTDGENMTSCIDVDNPAGWTEIIDETEEMVE